MNGFEKCSENKLSYRCEFFSFLQDECISERDYLQ